MTTTSRAWSSSYCEMKRPVPIANSGKALMYSGSVPRKMKPLHMRVAVADAVRLGAEVDPPGQRWWRSPRQGNSPPRNARRRLPGIDGRGPSAAGVRDPYPVECGVMKSVREPSFCTRSLMTPLSPSIMDATAITDVTPITMPRMVSPERTFRARMVSSATARFSSTSWRVIHPPRVGPRLDRGQPPY